MLRHNVERMYYTYICIFSTSVTKMYSFSFRGMLLLTPNPENNHHAINQNPYRAPQVKLLLPLREEHTNAHSTNA